MNNQVQRTVFAGDDAVTCISKYGIKETALQAAVEDGLLEIRQSTDLDAKTDPGSRAWGAVIRGLRRELLTDSEEWGFSFVSGLNLTHNKDKGLNILVMSGDKYTGLFDGNPKSKNPKGAATEVLVGENYELFNAEKTISSFVRPEPVDSMINFVLLYFFDYGNKEVRYELSIPDGMSQSAGKTRIASWKERYIFDAIPFVNKILPVKEEFNDTPEFTVIRKE
ncbi:TPA: hypothetical protein ACPYWN_003185 [Klebsiella oxytoca]|uniref:hypothetical protein n=1 Tax=Klebsiella pneumoniae TaxID=573 RepID=UPI000ED54E28|nr:hypothetical protein [Klebsiella pneumoniae]QMF81499.1 hypothetical protein HVY73_05690 [Klebsiella pneumoniae]RJK82364.1 hypothetical protein CMV56_01840 [Klebsiella pneumoniae]HDT4634426.1 hypothetical protein [Klebsiella pneumoniae]HDZ2714693.1 hypothetical protein [Klebsiella pneumoniae]